MTLTAPVAAGLASLEDAWSQSDRIFALLKPGAWLERPIPLRQPFLFYLGHLPAFAWDQLGRRALGRASFDAGLDALFARGIDPSDTDDYHEAPQAWPRREVVIGYRDRVRELLRRALEEDAGERCDAALAMVEEHERMHHETLLYMVHALAHGLKEPVAASPLAREAPAPEPGRVRVASGPARLGRPRGAGFSWDNEFPEHGEDVPAFTIDTLPVQNAEFLQFVEAGGYAIGRLWSEEAWAWLLARNHKHPHFWTRARDEFLYRGLFEDVPLRQVADWPVYVSWAEANAFARWRGARLMSEAEFHRAAFTTPEGGLRPHPWGAAAPAAEHGNFALRRWSPTAVGAHPAGASAWGVHELVGNGWEWTATRFAGFPGFAPHASYPGYSADFFDERHLVLLGASWATDARLIRRSFRNWFQPHYPYLFAKFRCVSKR